MSFYKFPLKLKFELLKKLVSRRIPTAKQIRRLPFVLSKEEKRALLVLGIVSLVAASVWVGGILVGRREAARSGGDYVEALVGAPRYINPALARTDVDLDITRLVFSGLVRWDGKNYIPDLAEAYEISADQKTYTVKLREGLRWHDGKPLTADDVIFTVLTLKNPKLKSLLAKNFSGVTVEKVDDLTVNFLLAEPFSLFLSFLTAGILPEHLWNNVPAESFALAEYNLKPIGSGPFKFQSFVREKRGVVRTYTLKRNNNFHRGKTRLQRITFKFFSDFETAALAALDRAVGGISYVPRASASRFSDKSGLTLYRFNLPQYSAVFLNDNVNAALRDKEVRQALVRAIDKEKLVRNIFGEDALLIHAPITPGFAGYHSGVKTYAYDSKAADDLLDGAGWKRDGATSTIRKKKNQVLSVQLTAPDQPESTAAAEFIQNGWEAIGVKVVLSLIPAQRIQKDIIPARNFEALIYGETLGGDSDLYPFWHFSQARSPGLNIAAFNNREANKLLEEARAIVNFEERAQKYISFQNILAEEAPAIFLWSPRYIYAVSGRVKAVLPENIVTPADRFAFIEEWTFKSQLIK